MESDQVNEEGELSDGVGFVDHIPPKRGSYDWERIARRCRSQPGVAYLVFEKDRTSLVVTLRAGRVHALRPIDGFLIETRNNVNSTPRTCDLYITYTGPPIQDAPTEES